MKSIEKLESKCEIILDNINYKKKKKKIVWKN